MVFLWILWALSFLTLNRTFPAKPIIFIVGKIRGGATLFVACESLCRFVKDSSLRRENKGFKL